MRALTLVDGELRDHLSALDRGLAYGHGLFETLRVHGDAVPLWERHLTRLCAGAARLHIPLENILPCLPQWRDRLLSLAAKASGTSTGVLKLVVTAGVGERGYGLPVSSRPTVILSWGHHRPGAAWRPARLRLCATRLAPQEALAGIKHLNRLEQVLARAEWQDGPWDEGLMLDRTGCVVECISSNLFLRERGRWYTPSLERAGVAGVMRGLLLERALPAAGEAAVIDSDITAARLGRAEEVFICNSVTGIRPVVEIEDLGIWSPGAGSARLQQFLAQHYGYPASC